MVRNPRPDGTGLFRGRPRVYSAAMTTLSRRNLLRLAVALPAAGLFTRYRAMAAATVNRVKITNVRAMAIKNIAGNCLTRIDPDAGVTG